MNQKLLDLASSEDFIRMTSTNSKAREETKYVLDGRNMSSKIDALNEIYTILDFKEYKEFANLDGLDELLSPDLWPDVNNVVLRINHAEHFVEGLSQTDLNNFLLLFRSAASEWGKVKGKDSFLLELPL